MFRLSHEQVAQQPPQRTGTYIQAVALTDMLLLMYVVWLDIMWFLMTSPDLVLVLVCQIIDNVR